MGRGLSPLQRWIVERAQQQSVLHHYEIFAEYFGWPVKTSWSWTGGKAQTGQQNFCIATIGERSYRRIQAIVSRACTRLEQRGLVACYRGRSWAGVVHVDRVAAERERQSNLSRNPPASIAQPNLDDKPPRTSDVTG